MEEQANNPSLSTNSSQDKDKKLSNLEKRKQSPPLPSCLVPYTELKCKRNRDSAKCLKSKCMYYSHPLYETPHLDEFACLKRFYPSIEVKINDAGRKRKIIAREIVSALHYKYPEFSKHTLLELMDAWNQQLSNSSTTPLREDILRKYVERGFQAESSCLRRLGVPQLDSYCISLNCSVKDDSLIKATGSVVERLEGEIESVELELGDKNGHPSLYHINIREGKMDLRDIDLKTPNEFTNNYLRIFGELISISRKQWLAVFNDIIRLKITNVTQRDVVGSDQQIREDFEEVLRDPKGYGLVLDWEDWSRKSAVLEVDTKSLWVPNNIMRNLITFLDYQLTLDKLKVILAPCMRGKTKQKMQKRFWVFNTEKIGLELPKDKLDSYLGESRFKEEGS